MSLEPPLTPDGVSGRMSGEVDGTTKPLHLYFATPEDTNILNVSIYQILVILTISRPTSTVLVPVDTII